jgi:hypothetical protein
MPQTPSPFLRTKKIPCEHFFGFSNMFSFTSISQLSCYCALSTRHCFRMMKTFQHRRHNVSTTWKKILNWFMQNWPLLPDASLYPCIGYRLILFLPISCGNYHCCLPCRRVTSEQSPYSWLAIVIQVLLVLKSRNTFSLYQAQGLIFYCKGI